MLLFTYSVSFRFCFYFIDPVVKNNNGRSVETPPCWEKEEMKNKMMVVKNNDGEQNRCVSACLRKIRIEEDEFVV